MKRFVVDAHGHCDEYTLFNWIDPPELVVDLMDKAGVDLTVITTYGEYPGYECALDNLVSYVNKFPDRLIGFVRVDPKGGDAVLSLLERAIKMPQIKGVKLHPVSNLMKPYNPFCMKVVRKAAELGLPLFFHCGDNIASQPWEIGFAAQECPEATIICHMGAYFHGEESLRMAVKCPNVYLDTSSCPYPQLIKKAVETLGPDRVVFASDSPAGDPISDLKKILNLGFDQDTEEKILYKNIARIIGLTSIRGQVI
jgi:predicted TIM-barrel fold metal-dependent hydrolase